VQVSHRLLPTVVPGLGCASHVRGRCMGTVHAIPWHGKLHSVDGRPAMNPPRELKHRVPQNEEPCRAGLVRVTSPKRSPAGKTTAMPSTLLQVRRDLGAGRLPPVQPFHAMAYPFSAELALAISTKYANYCMLTATRMAVPKLPHPPARRLAAGERLRVAYVSSDFGNHPLSHLMGSVFGLHDRSRVEVCPWTRPTHPLHQQGPRPAASPACASSQGISKGLGTRSC
jgi:Glycosyl transferase family 41